MVQQAIFYEPLRSLILPLKIIDGSLPKKGKIVDLGCGRGVVAKFLAKIPTREVIGVDLNLKQTVSNMDNLKFVKGDIRNFDLKNAVGVILSDVLHHLSYTDQMEILENIARDLKKGGVLIIKEIDSGEFLRSRLSRIWDFLLYPKDQISYFKSANLCQILEEFGFEMEIIRTLRFFPGSTTLFICRK